MLYAICQFNRLNDQNVLNEQNDPNVLSENKYHDRNKTKEDR